MRLDFLPKMNSLVCADCIHGKSLLWVFGYTYIMKFEVFCWNFSSSTNLQILRRDILKVEENDNCLVK